MWRVGIAAEERIWAFGQSLNLDGSNHNEILIVSGEFILARNFWSYFNLGYTREIQ